MTTIAIVAGMLPIALGRGAGAGSRASMAVTIIGGQMLCLLLTLLVTPGGVFLQIPAVRSSVICCEAKSESLSSRMVSECPRIS